MDTKSSKYKLLRKRARKSVQSDQQIIEKLKQKRKALGLTQEEVAFRMGVSQPDVSMIESGNADPRQSTIRRYANAIGCLIEHELVPFEDGSDSLMLETFIMVGNEDMPVGVEKRYIPGFREGVKYSVRVNQDFDSVESDYSDSLMKRQGA